MMRFSSAIISGGRQGIVENGLDFPRLALRSRTKSFEGRRPDSPALHRSKTEGCGFLPGQRIAFVLGPCDDTARRRVRSRRVPQRAALPGSKNPICIARADVGAGIYDLKECDYVDDAKVCARMALSFCAESERDSSGLGILNFSARGEALLLPPHLNPLPRGRGEETLSSARLVGSESEMRR